MKSYNPKSPLSLVDVHLIEGGVYYLDFPIRKMVYHGKENFLLTFRNNGTVLKNNMSAVMTISLCGFISYFGTLMRSSVTDIVFFLGFLLLEKICPSPIW